MDAAGWTLRDELHNLASPERGSRAYIDDRLTMQPGFFDYVWALYKELSRTQQSSWIIGEKATNVKHPVTYQEIQAWKAVMHRNPSQYEIELLLTLDEIAVN